MSTRLMVKYTVVQFDFLPGFWWTVCEGTPRTKTFITVGGLCFVPELRH